MVDMVAGDGHDKIFQALDMASNKNNWNLQEKTDPGNQTNIYALEILVMASSYVLWKLIHPKPCHAEGIFLAVRDWGMAILFNALVLTLEVGWKIHLFCSPSPLRTTKDHKISQISTSHIDFYLKLFQPCFLKNESGHDYQLLGINYWSSAKINQINEGIQDSITNHKITIKCHSKENLSILQKLRNRFKNLKQLWNPGIVALACYPSYSEA